MAHIELRSDDAAALAILADNLRQDLRAAGLSDQLLVGTPRTQAAQPTRGDVATLTTVLITAVAAGGALTVAMGKDGFLTALARVLEKIVESRKAEVILEAPDGRKLEIRGPVGVIKSTLKQLVD